MQDRSFILSKQATRLLRDQATATDQLKRLLHPDDRGLLQVWSTGEVSTRAIARALHRNHGTICRRLRLLREVLEDPRSLLIARRQEELPPIYRAVAIRHYLWRQSQRVIAAETRLGRPAVRGVLEDVEVWIRQRLARPTYPLNLRKERNHGVSAD